MQTIGSYTLRDAFRVFTDPKAVIRFLHRRMPGVLHVGYRSSCRLVRRDGRKYVRKTFHGGHARSHEFERECLADELFGDRPWKARLVEKGDGWLLWDYFPPSARLDHAAKAMSPAERWVAAKQAMDALREIHQRGFAHRDFHARNLYWIDGQIIVTDFEWLADYPADSKPPFEACYDLTGEGLPTPGKTGQCHFDSGDPRSLKSVLGYAAADIAAEVAATGERVA